MAVFKFNSKDYQQVSSVKHVFYSMFQNTPFYSVLYSFQTSLVGTHSVKSIQHNSDILNITKYTLHMHRTRFSVSHATDNLIFNGN
jgi:hypothetical protein